MVLYGVPAAGLIVALVELVKRSTGLETRWAPLLAVVLGVVLAVAARLDDPSRGTWLEMMLLGLLAGLGASGLYSGGKALTE